MKIDFATLAFGYNVKVGGATPNWATALGQGKEYKINESIAMYEMLTGMTYTAISPVKVSSKLGKGGRTVSGSENDSPITIAARFKRVFINDELIENGHYVILITRDTSRSHYGRLRFKYGPSNTCRIDDETDSNEEFWALAREQLGLSADACFFVYDISVKNQDTLILRTIFVNKLCSVDYEDTAALHSAWDQLIADDMKKRGIDDYETYSSDHKETVSETRPSYCLGVKRVSRMNPIHPLNSIVYGAPGTGKTYSMVEYSLAIIDNLSLEDFKSANPDRQNNIKRYHEFIQKGQIVFTTFHQNYGYEEFIQGLRPDVESQSMAFHVSDGVFKNIADTALNDQDNNYVIIIDEINRANISKVFGELITLIESDKRWGEENETCVTLQFGDVFTVPNNLYIIGTMNSADKSISLIDAALRRRFDFIEQKPDSNLIKDSMLKKFFINLNSKLVDELDSTDLLVGHAYFMNKSESDLCDILNRNIIPLLYEYFFDNRKKVNSVLKKVIDDSKAKVEIVNNKVGRISVKVKVAEDGAEQV